MFESDCSDDDINLSYKSATGFTKKEDVPLKLWAEHFSKPEKDRNTSLTKIFEKEFNFLKSLYCFLENDQVMGKTLTKFGIPNICGKINKKLFKLSSKHGYKVNKYERRNKTYLSKPRLLSKKIYSKTSSSTKQDFVTPRYTPVVERWSDSALNKFKSVQKIKSAQTYIFHNDHTLEKSKHKNAEPSTTPTVVRTHAELANRSSSDLNTQKRKEGIENNSPSAAVVDGMKGLLKQNDNKYVLKKCVRFNDNDLCSFAPTQEFLESLSRELSNNETTFDEISRDKSVLTLPDNAKTDESVSDKSKQETSAKTETNGLGNTSAILPLGISHLQESVGERHVNSKRSFENEKMIGTDFEVEPYDNENIVIEDFTESYSDSNNQVEQEKGILLNIKPGVNEITTGNILNTIHNVKINKERNQQLSNNLSVGEIAKARNQEQKSAEETNKDQLIIENNKEIEQYFLNSKTKIKILEKSLCGKQGKNIPAEKSVDSHLKTLLDIASTQINANSKPKENLFELRDILVQTSSQQQSISNELIDSESKDITVPETPTLDGTPDSKSCKSNVLRSDGCQLVVPNSSEESQLSKASVRSLDGNAVVLEIPPSNKTSVGSILLTTDKTNHIDLASRVVEDWSDDEFIPLSPLQPQNHNESSVNITAINGSIISSDGMGNHTKPCLVNDNNSLKEVFIIEDKHFENTSNICGMLSPCSSLSGRDYISNSSESEGEELLPTKEKYESSNLNIDSQNAKDLKITEESEISAKNGAYVNENKNILNDLQNEISFSRQTITDLSNLCTPNSELQTGMVGYQRQKQISFAVNAPSKVEKNIQTDSSTVEKSKENASQEEKNNKGLNLKKHQSLNSINLIQTLPSENKVRKILFPLQTQSSEGINDTKLLYLTTNSLNILNWQESKEVKETENQGNKKSMEETNKNDRCFSDVNLSNKGLDDSEMVNSEFYRLNSKKESFSYSSLPSKSGTGSQSNDLTVTENIIVCENEINERDEYESLSFISCSQTKNEDPFSVCSSIQNEHDTNLSSQNECALILLALSKEKEKSSSSDNNANNFQDKYKSQEVLAKPEASSVDISRKNSYPDLNNKNLARSEVEFPLNDEEVSTNKILCFPNKNVVVKSDNVPIESETIQNNDCIIHSYDSLRLDKSQEDPTKICENEISRNTLLKNYKVNKTSDKQESALCSNSFSTDSSKQLDSDLTEDCDKTLNIKKGTSPLTPKTPVNVCTDNEKSLEMECDSMEQMTQNDCNKESPGTSGRKPEHSKTTNISNQTTASGTVTAINSIKILPSSAIKPHIPTNKIMNSGESSGINFKEDSTTMESITIPSKIKSEMLSTTKSIKVKNKKVLKENSKMIFKNIVQSEDEDYNAVSPISTSSASSNPAHVLSHAKITTIITDTNDTANNNTKTVTRSGNELQLQTTQIASSYIQSSGINPTKIMGSENKKLPPKITNETLVTSNVHSKSTNIHSYGSENINAIDTVSANNGDKIFTKRQNVASQISSGINNQSTGDDTGPKNKKINKLVTSSLINVKTHSKKDVAELSDFIVVTSPQQHSNSKSKDNKKQNGNKICFIQEREASKATEFPLVPTTSYDMQQIRNDDTALSSFENRLKTNQSQLYLKRVEKNKNVDTSKSRLNHNFPVNDVPKKHTNLYSSNMILLSNKESLHKQSKLSDPHQNQIGVGKRDNLKIDESNKSIQFTTKNIPVASSRIGQNYDSIGYNFANHQVPKSVPVPYQTKPLKKYQVLISENTIKPQSQTPKLDIMIKKTNVSKNENHDSLRINSSSENKTGPVLKTTNLIPINNWRSMVQQTEPVHPKSTKQEVKKKCSGILLSSENLCVIRSSSHNEHQKTDKSELPGGSNQINKTHSNQNEIVYKLLPTIKLQNCKQENSKEEVKRHSQMQQHHHKLSTEGHPQMRLTKNKHCRSEKHGELKEQLTNASSSKHLNSNVISYTSSSKIKPLRFGQENLNEAEDEYKSLIEDSPSDSDDESFCLEERMRNLDNQLRMNEKDRFESLLTSDDESVQDFSGSIGCTDGNFSPLSSIGSDMLSNETFNNISKSSKKKLKRRFLENLDNYLSDDSNFEASPTKFTRKNMLCASSKENIIRMDGKIVSSDDCVPSYRSDMSEQLNVETLSSNEESRYLDISPQYDHDTRDMNNLDSIKGSDHTITVMTDSPIPSYSDGLNNDYLMSSPSRPDDCEENNSPFYDNNCESSDEDRNNYYLTDIFDD